MSFQPRSIARRVKDEQQLISETSGEIQSMLKNIPENDGFHDWKVGFLLLLRDFMNQLQKHFDLEEDSVFTEEIIRMAPHHKTTLDQFLETHRKILSALEKIIQDVKYSQVREALEKKQVARRLFDLLNKVLEHEKAERQLLQEVYYQEFGALD